MDQLSSYNTPGQCLSTCSKSTLLEIKGFLTGYFAILTRIIISPIILLISYHKRNLFLSSVQLPIKLFEHCFYLSPSVFSTLRHLTEFLQSFFTNCDFSTVSISMKSPLKGQRDLGKAVRALCLASGFCLFDSFRNSLEFLVFFLGNCLFFPKGSQIPYKMSWVILFSSNDV